MLHTRRSSTARAEPIRFVRSDAGARDVASTRLDNNRSGRCSNSASPRVFAHIHREAIEK